MPDLPRRSPLGALRAAVLHPSGRATRRIVLANLVAQVLIVVTGGAVRLTGSGLGCSTWPQCEPGQFTPVRHEATSWHPFIEFGNRTLTGVLVVIAVATAWAVWRQAGRARPLRLLALVPIVGVLVQAVLGGLTVLVQLHPALVGSHFLLSMVLVAASTQLLLRLDQPDTGARWDATGPVRAIGLLTVPLAVVMLVLGSVTTGTGPHSGDEDAPYRFALDPVAVTRAHSVSVWLYVAALVALVVLVHRSATTSPLLRGRLRVLLLVTLAQGLVGYVQYFTGLPGWMVALHMLGASVLVIAQTRLVDGLRTRETPTGPPGPDRASGALAAA
ncbi:heme A synthase [Actinotalea sp.]|uniref:COX15/CtaA family protein n=1 Tax=Actinotalea sp. TaxID=1872145 RepID=UPI0035678697